jgi:hypothetical protein
MLIIVMSQSRPERLLNSNEESVSSVDAGPDSHAKQVEYYGSIGLAENGGLLRAGIMFWPFSPVLVFHRREEVRFLTLPQ